MSKNTRITSVSLPLDVYEWLKGQAEVERRTFSQQLQVIVERVMDGRAPLAMKRPYKARPPVYLPVADDDAA